MTPKKTAPKYITVQLPEGAKYLKNAAAFKRLRTRYQQDDCYIGASPRRYPCYMVVAHVVARETGHSEVVPMYLYKGTGEFGVMLLFVIFAGLIERIFVDKPPAEPPPPVPDNDTPPQPDPAP